jgi:hypothetical protein
VNSKLPIEAKTIHWRGIDLGKAPERRGNKIDLFHVGTAMRAECEMQADLGFSQDGNAVIQILGGSIRYIAASQATVGPL